MTNLLESIDKTEAARLKRLMVDYLQEMAMYTTVPTDPQGALTYPYLEHYWREPDRFPFIVRIDAADCGFALVRRTLDPADGQPEHSIAEFFIKPEYRRGGLGTQVATTLIRRFPGNWEVSVLKTNLPAQPFWRDLLDSLCPSLNCSETDEHYQYRLKV